MKRIVLLAIIISATSGLGLTWYLASSFDFQPATEENPLGIQAVVAYVHDIKTSCQISPCGPFNALMFKVISKEDVQLWEYNICNGIHCIRGGGAGFLRGTTEWDGMPQAWGGGTIGNLPWKVGDNVWIRVKVAPVTITNDGFEEEIIPQPENVMFIDLGTSKIIEFND